MNCIAHIVDSNNRVVGIVDGPDACDVKIKVNGRTWRFDFDKWGGPLWLKADGFTPRKCQNPNKRVWAAFQRWFNRYQSAKGPKSPPRRELLIS